MTPKSLLLNAIDPALAFLATRGIPVSDKARVLVLAIAGQESAWAARLQVPVAYARSYWQFEEGGGVSGVVHHPASAPHIKAVCAEHDIPYSVSKIYEAMAWHDVLAASMARLLLFTDPHPLPDVGDVQAGWAYYQRNWRPGAPHPEIWPARYGTAMGQVRGAT